MELEQRTGKIIFGIIGFLVVISFLSSIFPQMQGIVTTFPLFQTIVTLFAYGFFPLLLALLIGGFNK
jgi:hypothetical protein